MREVYIEGEGELKAWTTKALEREEYLPKENKKNVKIFVKVYIENGQVCWELKIKNEVSVYKSIYELMSGL